MRCDATRSRMAEEVRRVELWGKIHCILEALYDTTEMLEGESGGWSDAVDDQIVRNRELMAEYDRITKETTDDTH